MVPSVCHVSSCQRPSEAHETPVDYGLHFTGIDVPTPISQIPRVENQNNLAINVSGWEKGVIVHHLSNQPYIQRINLLLLQSNNGKYHYIWIKNLKRLLYGQSKPQHHEHFFELYLHGYSRGIFWNLTSQSVAESGRHR